MKIRANHDQLDIVKDKLSESSIELRQSIEAINRNLDELKSIWQGEESNTFFMKFNNFLTRLNTVPSTYNNLSNFLGKANMLYSETDSDLRKEINDVRMNG